MIPLQTPPRPCAAHRPLAETLADLAVWRSVATEVEGRRAGETSEPGAYSALLASGAVERLVEAVLAGRHVPAPPHQHTLNRADRRRKTVYTLQPADEFLSRVLNRALQQRLAGAVSPRCHSFLPGRGVTTAIRSLLAAPGLDCAAWLHLDVADFFNSIDVEDLLRRLPAEATGEPLLMGVLEPLLRGRTVLRGGRAVEVGRKGVMAGTPLAPLLTCLYLRDLDDAVAATGAASARYSDDVLVLGDPAVVAAVERLLREDLAARGLRVNEAKSATGGPGEPWQFLGLRYSRGTIGLSANTVRKLRAKVRRRARRLLALRERDGLPAEDVCARFARSLNRKLDGVTATGGADFCWARWFFPMLTVDTDLRALDAFVQREIRYAATGSRRDRARSVVPYAELRHAGYVPLTAAYHRWRTGRSGPLP